MQRSELRNRKTKSTLPKNTAFFSTPATTSNSSLQELTEKLQGCKKDDVSDALHAERVAKLAEIKASIDPEIIKAMQDPKIMDEMRKAASDLLAFASKKLDDTPSFEATLLKTTAFAAISNLVDSYVPGSALAILAFSQLIPAAAAQYTPAQLKYYGGTPSNGANMCGGNIYCRDGYIGLVEDAKTWLGQVSTTVSTAIGSDMDLAFFDCCNPGKVGEAIKALYANTTQQGGLTCFANSIIYHGTQGTAQATNLADCNKFVQAVNPVFNGCVNYSSNVGMWIGVGFGCAAALAAIITLVVCCCANSDCRPKCC